MSAESETPSAPELASRQATEANHAASGGTAHVSPVASGQQRAVSRSLVLVLGGVAAVALVSSVLLWQKLSGIQEQLARQSQDTSEQAIEAKATAKQAQELARDTAAHLALTDNKLNEVALQRSQLEELMLAVSRTRDDSLVQDLESALQLAQQQALLTGSVQPLVSALQSAQARIARAAQPRLNPVSRAIARDVERIRAAALADLPALAGRIDEQIRQIDELPLLNAPVPPQQADEPAAALDANGQPQAATAEPAGATAWQRLRAWWSGWSARAWASVSATGGDLVRVHRMDQPEAALLAPDQEFFLRENAKLKLLNARLALLARQSGTAAADLRSVEATLRRYFDGRARTVQLSVEALQGLQRDLGRHEQLPRPDDTLAALAAAAVGR